MLDCRALGHGRAGTEPKDSIVMRLATIMLTLTLAGWGPAAAQPVAVDDWVTVRSRSFLLRSNAGPERAAEIARVLESFRLAFERLAPEMGLESPVPTRILAFRDAASFEHFTLRDGNPQGRVLGQFLTHPDGNFITMNADPRFFNGVGVVLHEYVHYLVAHNLPRVPRWFNEGLAEYYSTFAIEGGQAVVGRPVPRHLDWLRRTGEIELSEVLDADTPDDHAALEAGHFYAVSWGLVHYLLSSGEVAGSRLADFLVAAAGDGPSSDLFETIFEVRIDELEDRLRGYLLSEKLPAAGLALGPSAAAATSSVEPARPSAVLCDLAALALRLGNEEQSASFFDLALAYEPASAEAYAGLASVRSRQQRFEEADALFATALEHGPREARSFHLYGRHLLRCLEEARRDGRRQAVARLAGSAAEAFRAALVADPEFAEASALLGYVHLFGDLDPADGIGPLERAMRALPGRPDVAFQLLQLEVRRGGFERASELAAGPVRLRGGDEWRQRAEEEIERVRRLRAARSALAAGRYEEGLALLSEAVDITSDPELRLALMADLERLEARIGRR
jgi:tetratricopeptide (TPR) repeat protein